jgi:adenylate kinase family enzyme
VTGAPGSGKSTFMKKKMMEGYALLDYDQIMFSHPDWAKYSKSFRKYNNFLQFSDCISNKTSASYSLIHQALVQKGANLIIQVNLPNDTLHNNKIDRKYFFYGKTGYRSKLIWVHTPLKLAISRKISRNKEIGFPIPNKHVKYNYYKILSQIGFFIQKKTVPVEVIDGRTSSKTNNWKVVSNSNGIRFTQLSKN